MSWIRFSRLDRFFLIGFFTYITCIIYGIIMNMNVRVNNPDLDIIGEREIIQWGIKVSCPAVCCVALAVLPSFSSSIFKPLPHSHAMLLSLLKGL